jgi:hypothetical protein
MRPLVNNIYLLEKFNGKGGWTYAVIPEVPRDVRTRFGWVKVKGTIDGTAIGKCRLMPMGNGLLFLPVNAGIRKRIGKQAGAQVHIVLYADNDPLEIPEELQLCLDDAPEALAFFRSLSESEQNFYIKWIVTAKREETKISRLAKTINRLSMGLKMYDKDGREE